MNNIKMGTAIILAGGESKRFGYPKELLKLSGVSILKIITDQLKGSFNEIVIVTNQPELIEAIPLEVKITGDILTEGRKSSIRGLHAGLSQSSNKDNFVMACDMPFVNIELIKYMHRLFPGNDVVVPVIDTYPQPLYAFYEKSCVEYIEKRIHKGDLKLSDMYNDLIVKYIGQKEVERFDPGQKAFFNINNENDYKIAKEMNDRKKIKD